MPLIKTEVTAEALIEAVTDAAANAAWIAAIAVVARSRNAHEPGPKFKLLNELMGELDEARRMRNEK